MSIMSKHKVRAPADMSLPAEERGRRRRQGTVGGTPAAQMTHASSPRAARQRRDGERWLSAEEAVRFADARRVLLMGEEGFADHALRRIAEGEAS